MKQQYVHYPIFSSGEVLTKDLLENIANYSDEQGRITRSQFLGYGIISGLNYKFENNFLTISPGVALTASGNIICIGSETVYKYMEKMDDGLFKLTETNTAKSVKLRYSSSCVLAIRYEREDEKAYKCSEVSCDLNNIRKHIRFTPYLVPIDLVEKPSAFDEGLKEYMHLYRFNDVAFSLVTNFLHDNVRECFYKNSVKVISKLKDLDNRLANKKSSLGFLFSMQKPYSIRTPFVNALSILKKLQAMSDNGPVTLSAREKMENASPEIPVYFLHFLEDVEEAYNEFVDCYNTFLKKNGNFITRQGSMIDKDTIMLGNGPRMYANCELRNYFIPANNRSFEHEKCVVEAYLKRVAKLVENFVQTSNYWYSKSASIVSVNPHAPLAKKPIPFYYKTSGTDLEAAWTLRDIVNHEMKGIVVNNLDTSLESVAEVNAFNSPADYYEVGGYYNQKVEKVEQRLKDTINAHDLQLKIEKVNMLEIDSRMFARIKSGFQYQGYADLKIKAPTLHKIFAHKDENADLCRRRFAKQRMTRHEQRVQTKYFQEYDIDAICEELVTIGKFKTVEEANNSTDVKVLKRLRDISLLCTDEKFRFADHRYIPRKGILYLACYRNRVIFCFSS